MLQMNPPLHKIFPFIFTAIDLLINQCLFKKRRRVIELILHNRKYGIAI